MSELKKKQHPSKEVIETEHAGQIPAEHKFCEEKLDRVYELLQTTEQLAKNRRMGVEYRPGVVDLDSRNLMDP